MNELNNCRMILADGYALEGRFGNIWRGLRLGKYIDRLDGFLWPGERG